MGNDATLAASRGKKKKAPPLSPDRPSARDQLPSESKTNGRWPTIELKNPFFFNRIKEI
jgi:hypothetical protein